MKSSIDVIVVNQNGWWSVLCNELDVSGFGESEEAALAAFERALISTLTARLRSGVSRAGGSDESGDDILPLRGTLGPRPSSAQVVRRIPLASRESVAA